MPRYPSYIVDAFCDPKTPQGTGNPAAVVVLDDSNGSTFQFDPESRTNRQWMQHTAAEFNLSETAFVWKNHSASSADTHQCHFFIRFYTPTSEVALCGHATLASASVLNHRLGFTDRSSEIVFSAKATTLRATPGDAVAGAKENVRPVAMVFPVTAPQVVSDAKELCTIHGMVHKALGIDPSSIAYTGFGAGYLLLDLSSEDAFDKIGYGVKPNLHVLLQCNADIGVIVCCTAASNDIDFKSRMFAPAVGVAEDPVTGSAHCVLAPYFSKKLGGKQEMIAHQASQRGGMLGCLLMPSEGKVQLTGQAVIVLEGTLLQ